MDNLVSLLHAVGAGAVNSEVKAKILELIQSWAGATEGRYELSYIGEVCRTLQREGYQFPPKVTVASSMIDSSAVRIQYYEKCETCTDLAQASRMVRFRRLHAMPNRLYVYEPKAPLPQLWQLFRPAVLEQNRSSASSGHSYTCPCRRRLLRKAHRQGLQGTGTAAGSHSHIPPQDPKHLCHAAAECAHRRRL